jgi:hypothetical protein
LSYLLEQNFYAHTAYVDFLNTVADSNKFCPMHHRIIILSKEPNEKISIRTVSDGERILNAENVISEAEGKEDVFEPVITFDTVFKLSPAKDSDTKTKLDIDKRLRIIRDANVIENLPTLKPPFLKRIFNFLQGLNLFGKSSKYSEGPIFSRNGLEKLFSPSKSSCKSATTEDIISATGKTIFFAKERTIPTEQKKFITQIKNVFTFFGQDYDKFLRLIDDLSSASKMNPSFLQSLWANMPKDLLNKFSKELDIIYQARINSDKHSSFNECDPKLIKETDEFDTQLTQIHDSLKSKIIPSDSKTIAQKKLKIESAIDKYFKSKAFESSITSNIMIQSRRA